MWVSRPLSIKGIIRTESISERNAEENILTEQSICNTRVDKKNLSVLRFVSPYVSRIFRQIEVKFKLNLWPAIKAQQASRGILSVTSTLYECWWSNPRSGPFSPRKETRQPIYRKLGGPQGRYGRMRKISPPPVFDPQNVHFAVSCYTNYAIVAHSSVNKKFNCEYACYTVHLILLHVSTQVPSSGEAYINADTVAPSLWGKSIKT